MCTRRLFIGSATAIMLLGGVTSWAQTYTLEEIGALPDATPAIPTPPNSSASAINANGALAGTSAISGGFVWITPGHGIAEPWNTHAVLFADGALQDLGVLGEDAPPDEFPRPTSFAWGINGLRQVVGDATIVGDGYYRAFLWLPEPDYGLPAGMTEVPRLTVQARAYDINDDGVVVGESRLTPGSLGPRAVRWEAIDGEWIITDLGSLGQEYSIAYGINNLGQVTGSATIIVPPFQNNSHAFLWLPEPAYGLPAGMNNLTSSLPAGSIGRDVNELGQVVGRAPSWTPFIWLPEPAYGLPAGITQFPAESMFTPQVLAEYGFLGTVRGEFYAVNNAGVAVGNMEFAVQLPNGNIGLAQRGIVWLNGHFYLTQQFLPPDYEFANVIRTEDVNDAGQIAAAGADAEGNGRGLILTPVLAGDCDADSDVDALDYAGFAACLGGPVSPIDPSCACSDLDVDADVDLADYAPFQVAFTGS